MLHQLLFIFSKNLFLSSSPSTNATPAVVYFFKELISFVGSLNKCHTSCLFFQRTYFFHWLPRQMPHQLFIFSKNAFLSLAPSTNATPAAVYFFKERISFIGSLYKCYTSCCLFFQRTHFFHWLPLQMLHQLLFIFSKNAFLSLAPFTNATPAAVYFFKERISFIGSLDKCHTSCLFFQRTRFFHWLPLQMPHQLLFIFSKNSFLSLAPLTPVFSTL